MLASRKQSTRAMSSVYHSCDLGFDTGRPRVRLGRLLSTCPALSGFRAALHPVRLLNLAKGFFETMSFCNAEPNQFAQHVINFMSSGLVW